MTSTRLPCGLYEEDRIDHAEGALTGIFGKYVATHVAHCPACQAWLADYEEIGRLLQDTLQAPEEPWHRVQFTERLIAASRSPSRRHYPRLVLSALGAIVLVVLLTLIPLSTRAGFLFDHVIQFGALQTKQSVPPNKQQNMLDTLQFNNDDEQALSFTPIAPATLPAGLTLTEHGTTGNGDLNLLYKGNGVILLITESKERAGLVTVQPDGSEQIVTVDGTSVLILSDPRPHATGGMFWLHGGVLFSAVVLNAPGGNNGGYPRSDAYAVVRALNSFRIKPAS